MTFSFFGGRTIRGKSADALIWINRAVRMFALGYVWTVPWQELSNVTAAALIRESGQFRILAKQRRNPVDAAEDPMIPLGPLIKRLLLYCDRYLPNLKSKQLIRRRPPYHSSEIFHH